VDPATRPRTRTRHGAENDRAHALLTEKYPQCPDAPPDSPVLTITIVETRTWTAT
jgi:hypothetical protein